MRIAPIFNYSTKTNKQNVQFGHISSKAIDSLRKMKNCKNLCLMKVLENLQELIKREMNPDIKIYIIIQFIRKLLNKVALMQLVA